MKQRDWQKFMPYGSFLIDRCISATVNDPDCAARVRQASEELGLTVVPWISPGDPLRILAGICMNAPALCSMWGTVKTAGTHQEDYDFNDRILKTSAGDIPQTGGDALTACVPGFFPTVREKIRPDHRNRQCR
jgi:hypothetical protein